MMIYYYVSAPNPLAHLFHVRMIISDPHPQGQRVSLPNWIPGSYLIRDFARHIVSIDAYAGENEAGSPIKIHKIDSNTWECEKQQGPITIAYSVYAWDPSVRGAHLDGYHGFFNGSCLFLKADGPDLPCKVKISPPNCEGAENWQVATTLQREAPLWGFGWYEAKNYDELIDHPVEMGKFEINEFKVNEIPHTLVISGKHNGDISRLVKDLSLICKNHMDLFIDPPPFEKYLFLLTVLKEGYGGLEHRNSTALICQRDLLPIKSDSSMSRGYISLLGLFSHEYFHAWNIKKIKPLAFTPYDLNQKTYTEQLWIFEGITSYYDELALVRSKAITREQYFDLLAQNLTKLLRNPGRKKQTLTEASFDAWTKFYQPNENTSNATVSYYLKGSIVALAFDLSLRLKGSSLDELMKTVWSQYGKKDQGLPEKKLEEIMNELAKGTLTELIHSALYTTKDLALEKLFLEFGLTLTLRAPINADDFGGKVDNDPEAFKPGILGCTIVKNFNRVFVASVVENSPAQLGGLSAQDEIVAINEMRIDPDSFDKILKRLCIGEKIKMVIFRQDLLKQLTITLMAPVLDTAQISVNETPTEEQSKNLIQWLS